MKIKEICQKDKLANSTKDTCTQNLDHLGSSGCEAVISSLRDVTTSFDETTPDFIY